MHFTANAVARKGDNINFKMDVNIPEKTSKFKLKFTIGFLWIDGSQLLQHSNHHYY